MQGLANHIVPKPCVVGRETGGEASVDQVAAFSDKMRRRFS